MKKRIVFTSLLILFIFSASKYFAARAQGPWTLTVSSLYGSPSPSGGSFADGTDITASVTSPWPGGSGIQYICTGWSGSGSVPPSGTSPSVTFNITADSSITWNWKTQYYLTVTSGYDTPSGSGWYDGGSTVYAGLAAGTVPGGAGTQYVFTSWSGDASGTNYAQSDDITMNGPKTAIANWITQYYLTVSNGGHGTAGGQGWYDADSNAQATITPLTVAGTTGTQYIFAGWTGDASGSGSPSNNVLMDGPKTATATWTTQYYLTVGSAYSTPSGSGWYDGGSTVYAGLAAGTVPGGAGTQYVFTSWSGDASGTNYAQSDGITMNGPKTAIANWKTQYYLTVTSPYDSPTPVSGWFDSGSSVTESVTSPTPGPSGTQYVVIGWTGTGSVPSSGSGTTVTFTIAQSSSITWNWKIQYYLTASSSYDSPTPSSGWFDSGSNITETVTSPTPGPSGTQYVCTGWSGSGSVPASGTSSSVSFTITAASSITWNWKIQHYFTVSSAHDSPSPVSGWFDSGSGITESVTSPVSGGSGTQYVCTGWTGTGSPPASGTSSSVSFTITAASSITWNWKTQYQVTFDKTGVGSDFLGTVVTVDSVNYGISGLPVSFWFDSGSSHSFSFASPLAVGSKQYAWSSTSGLSTLQSGTLTVTASGSVVGNYLVQNQVTFDQVGVSSDFTGTVVIIDSVGYSRLQLPVSFSWSVGSTHNFAFQSSLIVGSTSKQYVWTSTSGLSSVQSGSITVTTYGNIIGNYKTQYYFTVSSAYGSPSPVSGWFDSGSGITESVTSPVSGGSGTQYVCTGWSGSGGVPGSGTSSSVTFTITQASSITWNWKTQYSLLVSSNYDSPSPISGWFDSGSSVTESVTSPAPGPSGTQYVVIGWTGTGSVPSSGSGTTVTFTIARPSGITWNWKIQYYLTASSPYDSPTPVSGWFDSGSSITETVTSPASGGSGTHYVCTGWTGTGSVPPSGSSSSVTFTITGASSITWNWQLVQRRLTVSSAHDSPNPGNGLHIINDGVSVTCSVSSPVTESGTVWTCTGWTGTGSVPSSGTGSSVIFTISQDSTITWNWHGNAVQHTLTVFSAHGSPSPAVGNHLYDEGDSVTCSVTSPVTESGVAYVCTGWTGTGSVVPSSGSGSSVTFTISQDSSITWNWQIVLWNLTVSSAHGSPNPAVGDHPYNDSASVTCSVSSPVVEAGVSYTCTGWVGSGSVPSSGSGVSVTFSITQNSSITWSWVVTPPAQWNLGVVSAHGSPSPGVGDRFYDDGSSVTCSVSSPVDEGGVSYTCTGWVGTGSVPSSGSDTSTTFTITENSTITWNWVVTPHIQWNLTVSSAHDSPSPGVGDNPYDDGSSVNCSVTSSVTEAGQVWTCTGWVGSGSVPTSGSGSFVTFAITENSTITWNWQVQERPTIGSCDGTGAQKDVFNSDETAYVTGTGYEPNQTYNIYVVNDTAWVTGMTIPARIQGTATSVSSNSSGNINPTALWSTPLTPGKYDILVDFNDNGKYDAGVDALFISQITAASGYFFIPEYVFGTILGLAGCFAALGVFRMYKRKRHQNT